MRRRHVGRRVRQAAITRADGAGAPRAIDEEACEAFEQSSTRGAPLLARYEAARPWSRQETIATRARVRLPRSTVRPPEEGEDVNDLTGVDEGPISSRCRSVCAEPYRSSLRRRVRTCELALDRRCDRRDGVPPPALQPGGALGEVA